jgi:hypothetical protein
MGRVMPAFRDFCELRGVKDEGVISGPAPRSRLLVQLVVIWHARAAWLKKGRTDLLTRLQRLSILTVDKYLNSQRRERLEAASHPKYSRA